MALFAAQKRRVVTVLLVVYSVLQAALAQFYSPNDSVKNLEPVPLVTRGCTGNTIQLAAFIPAYAVKDLGNFRFLAVFKFPALGSSHTDKFGARIRRPLTGDEGWYIKWGADVIYVYAAMELPLSGDDQSNLPEIVIDVECSMCDLQRANVSLTEYSRDSFTRESLYYQRVFTHLTHTKNDVIFSSGGTPRRWTADFNKTDLCVHPHDTEILFSLTYSEPWTVKWTSSTASRNAQLFRHPERVHDYYVLFSPAGEGDFCSPESDLQVSLEISCIDPCEILEPRRMRFLGPLMPQSASLNDVSAEGVWQEAPGVCSLQVEDPEKKLKKKGLDESEIFRLWYNATEGCKTTSSDSETFDYSLYWNSRQQVHNLERQLNDGAVARDRLQGVGKCVCERLKGRVYRLLDGGPLDQHRCSPTVRPPNPRRPATAIPANLPNDAAGHDNESEPSENRHPRTDPPANPPKDSGATEDDAGHDNESEPGENRHPRTDPPANPPKDSRATEDEAGHDNESETGENRHPRTDPPANPPKDSGATEDETGLPRRKNPVTGVPATQGGDSNQDEFSVDGLRFNTTTGSLNSKGLLEFHNWIPERNHKANVPFVTFFCFSPKSSASRHTIESVSLGGKTNLESFSTSDPTLRCFAFNSCDAWEVGYPGAHPSITVVGKNVSERLLWRLDEAIPFGNSSSNGIDVGRGGRYGSAEQREKFNDPKELIETTVIQMGSFVLCVDPSRNLRTSKTGGAETKVVSSAVYVRPPYQLDPNVTLSYSGDGCSLSVTAFFGAFVVVALHYLQGRP